MTTDQLEAHLTQNPHSPLFARLAAERLRAKRIDEALTLCLEGMNRFPGYPTAHFVLARCLAQKGDYESALEHIGVVFRSFPGNPIVVAFRNNWRELDRLKKSQAGKSSAGQSSSPQSPGNTTARRPAVGRERSAAEEEPESSIDENPIVSVTLAEIYTTQGAYQTAIAMYRKLQLHKPQQADQFEQKIRELREKLRQQT